MSYWHRYYRPDLMGWKVTRISDPSAVPQQDVIWLEDEPADLDPTGMFYIDYDPNLYPPLAFSTDLPSTKSVATGAAISIGPVVVSGGRTPYTYAWTKDGSAVAGQTAATFSKAAAVAGDAGSYVCKVTDENGKTANSKACVLTVTA